MNLPIITETHRTQDQRSGRSIEGQRGIPSLDGLRGICILSVVIAHGSWYLPSALTRNVLFQYVIGNGFHGVAVFFVISGYLITGLLIREFNSSGAISLSSFYFRRSLRIFPPFYVFLGGMALLWALRIIPEDWKSFLTSATYTWAYYPYAHGYYITHTWSLSIEEQFYLFWPIMVIILYPKGYLIKACVALIILFPLVRLLSYFLLPTVRGHEFYMFHGWTDTIIFGCLLAAIEQYPKWEEVRQRFVSGWTVLAAMLVAFLLNPFLLVHLPKTPRGFFAYAINPSITGFGICVVLIYCISDTTTIAAQILNTRLLKHIGLVSYSLYLWQQLFMSYSLKLLPYGFLYALLCAEASFWLVEKPSFALRRWIQQGHIVRTSRKSIRCATKA